MTQNKYYSTESDDVLNLQSPFDEALNDAGGKLNELKGILSETLGDLPFKVAIVLVVLSNLLYTFYEAYFGANLSNVIESDCYCRRSDKLFYRVVTFGFSTAWILVLAIYALHSTLSHTHLSRLLRRADRCTIEMEHSYKQAMEKIDRRKKYLESELEELVTTTYLDTEYFVAKKYYLTKLYEGAKPLKESAGVTEDLNKVECFTGQFSSSPGKAIQDDSLTSQPKKWYCFMICKLILLTIRFSFRILIVPLLQLQWLNDYAWNCTVGGIWRDYCETVTNTYFLDLDHSLVLYSVYVLILVALLFSVVISWLPKGIPQVILPYESMRLLEKEQTDITIAS